MSQLNPFQMLRLEHLAPSPTNPRKQFDPVALAELAATIREHGVIEPIIVRFWPDEYDTPADRAERPLYEIIAGERRYRASVLAEQAEIPALVRHLDTRQVLEVQIIENLQRRGVNELEEAEGYDLMMREFGYTAEQLAEKVGKSKAYIYARLKLTALCEVAREAFRAGDLNPSTALLIARIPGAKLQERAAKDITQGVYGHGPMSYREAASHVQSRYMLKLDEAPFPYYIDDLLPTAGGCKECPKRTGNSPELFPDVKNADVCTDPDCFAEKKEAWLLRQLAEAKAKGVPVISGKEVEKIAPYGVASTLKGYTKLGEKNYEVKGYPTNRELLAGQDLKVTLIEDVRSGQLVEVVDNKAFAEALKAAGVRDRGEERKKDEQAETAKRKAEVAYREALFGEIRREVRVMLNSTTRPGLYRADDLLLVTRQFWARTGFDAQCRLAKLHIKPGEKMDNHDRVRELNEAIDGFTTAQLVQFLFDLSLINMLDLPTYSTTIDTPAPLIETARSFDLSPEDIRAGLQGGTGAKAGKKGASPLAAAAECNARRKADGVQYRHPQNPDLTWTGRGRKPQWVVEWLLGFGTLEQLAVPERDTKTIDMYENA